MEIIDMHKFIVLLLVSAWYIELEMKVVLKNCEPWYFVVFEKWIEQHDDNLGGYFSCR